MKQDILIIGDDGEQIEIAEKILANQGHNVKIDLCLSNSTDIEQLADYIIDHPPSVIYIIITKDNKKYYNLIRNMQQDQILSKIPKIVVGEEKEKSKKQFMKLKISDYIYLPIKSMVLSMTNSTFIKSKVLLNFKFTKPSVIQATLKGDIIRINEISAYLNSPIKFAINQAIKIDSEYIKNALELNPFNIKICKESVYVEAKTYLTELVILGMKEKNEKKIRAIQKT